MTTTIFASRIAEKLYESGNSVVYRAQRESDGRPVILKMLNQVNPAPRRIAWFKREFERTKNLAVPGVVAVYDLLTDQHRWAMTLEDFGGESLERLHDSGRMKFGEMELAEFLQIAIRITEILGRVHQSYVIHRDINPANIVFNPATGETKLIDFGISVNLSRGTSFLANPGVLEGTLAYISPEQTGRMNRAIDYSTDFYSLGVTFYRMLTGALPFSASDPMSMVHAHIAQRPTPPHRINKAIPVTLSKIVMKLMAKNAEDRYQSARGFEVDLEECLEQCRSGRSVGEFTLARHDVPDRFRLPQKLYGREEGIAALMSAFSSASEGTTEMLLVAGYSGVGKSALVREVYKPITEKRGYFVSGKFDELSRDTPYIAFSEAFGKLIRQILAESEERLAGWRSQLSEALHPNGRIIAALIPELDMLMGQQPDVPELNPSETQNRFNQTMQSFIQVFARREHPLVMFLDDLQWADAASLKLMSLLVTGAGARHLLLVGAYRDNEVDELHPLTTTLQQLEKAGVSRRSISLAPLQLEHVSQLLCDTLHCGAAEVQPLAQLVLNKTGGIPFVINELSRSLYADGLLTFDYECGAWRWALADIEARDLPDNVVNLMVSRLEQLDEATQRVLMLAACTKGQFDLATLAVIQQQPAQRTAQDLNEAVTEGFLIPLDEDYKLLGLEVPGLTETLNVAYRFTHDRIREAAYAMTPPEKRQSVHLRIGRLLLDGIEDAALDQHIFDIVSQFERGAALLVEQGERDQVARLCLRAGRKAKASAAYLQAFEHLGNGLRMLQPAEGANGAAAEARDAWQRDYDLALALHIEALEAAFLSGRTTRLEELADILLERARTVLEKVPVYVTKIRHYTGLGEYSRTIESTLEVLQHWGITFATEPTRSDVEKRAAEVRAAWLEKGLASLIDLPVMTNERYKAALDIIHDATHALYISNPLLYQMMILEMVDLSIAHGHTPVSAPAYTSYGVILCGALEDIDAGYQFGKLGVELSLRLEGARKHAAYTLGLYNLLIVHWKQHLRTSLPGLWDAYQQGLVNGHIVKDYVLMHYCGILHALGAEELGEVDRALTKYGKVLAEGWQPVVHSWQRVWHLAALVLLGKLEYAPRLADDTEAAGILRAMEDRKDGTGCAMMYCSRSMVSYILGHHEHAYEAAILAEQSIKNMTGMPYVPLVNFYGSLARLGVCAGRPAPERERLLAEVDSNQRQMEIWAGHAPMNYRHKHCLVEAERARIAGEHDRARTFYDDAIDLAHEQQFFSEEALAHELAGRFYLEQKRARLSRYYLQDAHYAYQLWGASTKIRDLERRYPQFLRSEGSRAPSLAPAKITITETSDSAEATETTTDAPGLDLHTVIRASRAITGESDLRTLLSKVMEISLENAGAQRGVLVLEREGALTVKVKGRLGRDRSIESTSIELTECDEVAHGIVQYVARTSEIVVLNNAVEEGPFTTNPYVQRHRCRSVLCFPIINQGVLSGIVFMENRNTTGAFSTERLEVLKLLMTPAAISIENALLKDLDTQAGFSYQVGGSLAADSSSYVTRQCDRALLDCTQAGVFCYVLDARQMGKSSLRVRTMRRLDPESYACVTVDMTMIGSAQISAEQWYAGIARALLQGLGLGRKVKLQTWWRERDLLPPVQRLAELCGTVLLEEIEKSIVVFIDEIDSVLGLDFVADDFFAMIRGLFEKRAEDPRYQRLTFVLFGVASPSNLIADKQRTPFNIGKGISMSGFQFAEARSLLSGFVHKTANPEVLLRTILGWTQGQPFLTQKVCQLVRNADTSAQPGREAAWVERLVQHRIIDDWEAQDEPEHLKTIRDRIMQSGSDRKALLSLYRSVLETGGVATDKTSLQAELLLTGLVTNHRGSLKVANRIYRQVFSGDWLDTQLALVS